MSIKPEYVKLAQILVNERGANPPLKVDGDWGRKSIVAAAISEKSQWRGERLIPLVVQNAWNRWADKNGRDRIKVDGWWGPDTDTAAEALLAMREGRTLPVRPDEQKAGHKGSAQCHDGSCSAVRCWSPTDAQMTKFYGEVGSHQRTVAVPYPMVLDWEPTTVTKITLHEKVADSALAAFEEILAAYGLERLKELGLTRFGGSLNVRKKRGGSTWSAHAWGTAMDFWPEVNALRETHRTARFAREEYAEWFQIWEKHGWLSLGRCFDFDWMHVQKNPE